MLTHLDGKTDRNWTQTGIEPNTHTHTHTQTPLHLVATKGYAKCIQILLDHGADMELENTHRATSLDLVRGKKNCEKVFLHAVAKVQIPSQTREQQQRMMGEWREGTTKTRYRCQLFPTEEYLTLY